MEARGCHAKVETSSRELDPLERLRLDPHATGAISQSIRKKSSEAAVGFDEGDRIRPEFQELPGSNPGAGPYFKDRGARAKSTAGREDVVDLRGVREPSSVVRLRVSTEDPFPYSSRRCLWHETRGALQRIRLSTWWANSRTARCRVGLLSCGRIGRASCEFRAGAAYGGLTAFPLRGRARQGVVDTREAAQRISGRPG